MTQLSIISMILFVSSQLANANEPALSYLNNPQPCEESAQINDDFIHRYQLYVRFTEGMNLEGDSRLTFPKPRSGKEPKALIGHAQTSSSGLYLAPGTTLKVRFAFSAPKDEAFRMINSFYFVDSVDQNPNQISHININPKNNRLTPALIKRKFGIDLLCQEK